MEILKTNNGCFMTEAELEYLREKFSQNHDLSRIFNHIDALEALIKEKTEELEGVVNQNTEEWEEIGQYVCDSENQQDEMDSYCLAQTERILELERSRDINKDNAVTMANEVIRLMRKVPYKSP
jgi:hypothetical protein